MIDFEERRDELLEKIEEMTPESSIRRCATF